MGARVSVPAAGARSSGPRPIIPVPAARTGPPAERRRPHLVRGPAPDNGPIRFRGTLNAAPPGGGHGVDVDAGEQSVVTGRRLDRFVRHAGAMTDPTLGTGCLDPGVRAHAFTFG